MFTGRSPEKAAASADCLAARAGSFAEAARHADAALVAVLYQGMEYTLERIGDRLHGKPVIDCANPAEIEGFTLATPPWEQIAKATGGHVVKAFNLCHADVWRMPSMTFDGRPLAIPYCGDDPAALRVTAQLIKDTGGVPLPTGDLRHAQYLEARLRSSSPSCSAAVLHARCSTWSTTSHRQQCLAAHREHLPGRLH
jgi:8-hydroxy-5-deazaflavin:NADPH oxidoreductase